MNGGLSLWWSGALRVQLYRGDLARVVPALHRRGVRLTDVHQSSTTLELTLALGDFSTLYQVCRAHHVKIRFLGRFGFPFLLRALSHRKAFVAGVALFLVLLYASTTVIWSVSVTGADTTQVPGVLAAARASGLYPGAPKRSLANVNQISRELLAKLPDAIWVGVRVTGVKAQIEVVKKIPDSKRTDEAPRDIVIKKPGVILRVLATRGDTLVKPGQTVYPGQVAISGNLAGGEKQVPATGEVLAEVWYKSTVKVPLSVHLSGLTGASVSRDYLSAGSAAVRVWGFAQPNYTHSVERTTQTNWRIGSWRLPVQWTHVELLQVRAQDWRQSEQAAAGLALQLAKGDIRRQMGENGVILGQTVLQRQVSRGNLYETVMTRTEEDIGAPAPIRPKLPEEGAD